MTGVTDVTLVTLPAANGGEELVCAHCRGEAELGNPFREVWMNGVEYRLHARCIDRVDPDDLGEGEMEAAE